MIIENKIKKENPDWLSFFFWEISVSRIFSDTLIAWSHTRISNR